MEETKQFSRAAWDTKINALVWPIRPSDRHLMPDVNYLETTKVYDYMNRYLCPDCENGVVACRGSINRWHFKHAILTTCKLLDKPISVTKGDGSTISESKDHYTSKVRISNFLRGGGTIHSFQRCNCDTSSPLVYIKLEKDQSIHMEYTVDNGIADLVIVHTEVRGFTATCTPVFIIEVLHTHKTLKRNIDWAEFDTRDILEAFKNVEVNTIAIRDKREYRCTKCIDGLQITIPQARCIDNDPEPIAPEVVEPIAQHNFPDTFRFHAIIRQPIAPEVFDVSDVDPIDVERSSLVPGWSVKYGRFVH